MDMNSLDLSKAKIVISNHARQRFKQRFGLIFHKFVQDRRMLDNFIIAQVSTGRILDNWKQYPFYCNKIRTKHGLNTEVITKSSVYYMVNWSPQDSTIVVKTCIRSFFSFG